MTTDEAPGETTRQHLFPVLVLLLIIVMLLSAVATVPLLSAATAGTDSTNDTPETFASFTIDFESADPEEPVDVEIQWNVSGDADDVEKVRIAITNESGSPINVYRPAGEDVPNPFTVSEGRADSKRADIIVDDVSTVELTLKLPPGHCDRVEAVEATALESSNESIVDPDIERTTSCTSDADAGTFEVTIDEYDQEVTAGENVDVTADVRNTGDAEATQNVRFLVDGDERETTNLTLAANQSERVAFSDETNESDVGEHEIVVESDDDAAHRTVNVTRPAFFVVSFEDVPGEVAAGETITATAQIRNTGDHTDTQNITLADFDGDIVDTIRNLELSPNESTTVTATWSTDGTDVGEGNVTVRSDDDSDTEAVNVTRPSVESIDATLQDSVIGVVEETSITVEAEYMDGSTRTVTDDATLTANDTTVATVTTHGTVTAESEGQTAIEAAFEGETDAALLTVEAPDTDDSASDDSPDEDNSNSDTSSGGSGSEDADSDDSTDDETSAHDETESDDIADSDDAGADGSNDSDVDGSDDSGVSDSDDSDVDDSEDSDVEDSDGGADVETADTDDSVGSGRTATETDETTIAFFPVLGLLLLPMLALVNRDLVRW